MANEAISQLTAGTPPYPAGTLFIASVPSGGGYTSYKVQLSDILASGTLIQPFVINWDSNTPVLAGTSVVIQACPWTSCTVTSLSASCAGGSFTAEFEINGTPIGGLSAVTVSTTPATTNAASANTMTSGGGPLTMIISAVSGSPTTACLQLNLQVTA